MLSAALLLPALSLLAGAQAQLLDKRANPDLGLQTFYTALGGIYATYVGCATETVWGYTDTYFVSGTYNSPTSWGLYPALQASCDQQQAKCNAGAGSGYTTSQCSTQANNCQDNRYLAVNAYQSGGYVCPDYAQGTATTTVNTQASASTASVASVSSQSAASVSSVSVSTASVASVASVSSKSVQITQSVASVASVSTVSTASVASVTSASVASVAVASVSSKSALSVQSTQSTASTASVASVSVQNTQSVASVASVSSNAAAAQSTLASQSAQSASAAASNSKASALSTQSTASVQSVQNTQSVASVASVSSNAAAAQSTLASQSAQSVAVAASNSNAAVAASIAASVSSVNSVASVSSVSAQSTASAASVLSVNLQATAAAQSAASVAATSLSAQASASAVSVSKASVVAASTASVASVLSVAAAAASQAAALILPAGYKIGSASLIAEGSTGRALTGPSEDLATMTPSICATYCTSQGYALSGTEYSSQCYCGNALSNGASLTNTASTAAMTCAGDAKQACGGFSAISLVYNTALASLSSGGVFTLIAAPVALPTGYKVASSSLISEGSSGRALTGASTSSSTMTPTVCATYCTAQGYALSGAEYGSECYCGNALSNGISLSSTSTATGMSCAGDAAQICGGFSALSVVYNTALASVSSSGVIALLTAATVTLPNGYNPISTSLIAEGPSGRALAGTSTSDSAMTPTFCANFCTKAGYALSGTEYATECYCGNSFSNGASPSLFSTNTATPCGGDSTQTCGAGSALSVVYNTALATYTNGVVTLVAAPVVTLPTGYKVLTSSLIAEGPNGRALTGASTSSSSMTPSTCATYCTAASYAISGTEYSTECYCGNALSNGATLSLTSTATAMPCGGDSTQTCGGSNAISLVYNTALATVTSGVITLTAAPVVTLPTGYKVLTSSLIAEGARGRALTGASTSSSSMTPSTCATYCTTAGYALSGTEYSTECYCGNALSNGASLLLTSTATAMPCGGASTQTCGGNDALSLVYNTALATVSGGVITVASAAVKLPTGYKVASTSTIAEGSAGRALTGPSTESADMTPTVCANYCTAQGYAISGTEYATQCYCGSTLSNGASLSLTSTSTMSCGGDSTQTCGGFSALSVVYNSALATLSGGVLTSTAAPAVAAVTTLTNGFKSDLACWSEANGRLMTGAGFTSSEMTYDLCTTYCFNTGFAQAGVEWGQECYCSNTVDLTKLVTNANCNVPCAGDSSKICGGAQALQIFTTTASVSSILTLANGWTSSQVCYAEGSDARLLPSSSLIDDAMTPTMCTNFCASGGFTQAGVEYGTQCYCASNVKLTTAALSTNCNMACAGDQGTVCGGSNAIDIYTTTSTSKTRRFLPRLVAKVLSASH